MCSKKDLLAYLKSERIPFLVDRTNRDETFTRNRVRAKLIPWLEKNLNPSVKEALFDLQDSCERAQDHLDALATKKYLSLSVKKSKGAVGVPITHLKRLDAALLSEILRRLYVEVRGDGNAITAVHRFAMERLLATSSGSGSVDLPGSMWARRKGFWLWMEKKPRRAN
jgi:tRNA(Ile)-lysidine synthase